MLYRQLAAIHHNNVDYVVPTKLLIFIFVTGFFFIFFFFLSPLYLTIIIIRNQINGREILVRRIQ